MKKIVILLIVLMLFLGIFISPWLFLSKNINSVEWDEKAHGTVGLIFGTRVIGDEVSPLLKERLEMGLRFYKGGKLETLVVSNTEDAAFVMKTYLVNRGVPEEDIVLDTQAVMTRDSCKSEIVQKHKNSVLFFSQSFHLPRISYECKKLGVLGGLHSLIPAERIRYYNNFQSKPEVRFEQQTLSKRKIIQIRTKRHFREMSILWADIIFQKFIF